MIVHAHGTQVLRLLAPSIEAGEPEYNMQATNCGHVSTQMTSSDYMHNEIA